MEDPRHLTAEAWDSPALTPDPGSTWSGSGSSGRSDGSRGKRLIHAAGQGHPPQRHPKPGGIPLHEEARPLFAAGGPNRSAAVRREPAALIPAPPPGALWSEVPAGRKDLEVLGRRCPATVRPG